MPNPNPQDPLFDKLLKDAIDSGRLAKEPISIPTLHAFDRIQMVRGSQPLRQNQSYKIPLTRKQRFKNFWTKLWRRITRRWQKPEPVEIKFTKSVVVDYCPLCQKPRIECDSEHGYRH